MPKLERQQKLADETERYRRHQADLSTRPNRIRNRDQAGLLSVTEARLTSERTLQ
jgi:putative heme degradation protein